MALFGRRRGSDDAELLEGDFDDFEDDDFEDDDEPLPPARWSRPRPDPAPAELKPIDLRDWEIPAGYVVAGLIVVAAVIELTITHGQGAPPTPPRILPGVSIVLAIGVALTIRFRNRIVTGIAAAAAALVLSFVQVPVSVGVVRVVGFIAAFAYAFIIIQRQSSAQRRLNREARERGRGGASRGGSTGRGGQGGRNAPEPTSGPRASRRYTPPKPRDDNSRTRRR